MRRHFKTNSEESQTNAVKCNQCDYAFSQAGDLRKHLQMCSEEKSDRFNRVMVLIPLCYEYDIANVQCGKDEKPLLLQGVHLYIGSVH